MAGTPKPKSSSGKPSEMTDTYEEERYRKTMFEALHGTLKGKTVLQRLIVVAQLHEDADRTEVGARYERLQLQLGKQHMWDNMTGLLLLYPAFLLHVVESSREILVSVLKELRDMQHPSDSSLVEASKVVFMVHDPQRRLFQQWSYKVLDVDQLAVTAQTKDVQEEEESTDVLVCSLLSALQKLRKTLDTKAPPGPLSDETAKTLVPQHVLAKLMARDELLSPQQYLQMYNSHLNIRMDFGQVIRSSSLTTV